MLQVTEFKPYGMTSSPMPLKGNRLWRQQEARDFSHVRLHLGRLYIGRNYVTFLKHYNDTDDTDDTDDDEDFFEELRHKGEYK